MELPTDIEISNNIFWVAFQNYSYHSQGTGGQDYRIPTGYNSHDNVIVMQPNGLLQFPKPTVPGGNSYAIEDAAAWQAYANTEAGSHFVIIPPDIDLDVISSSAAKVEAIYAYLSTIAHLSTIRSEFALNAANRAVGRIATLEAQVQAMLSRLDAIT